MLQKLHYHHDNIQTSYNLQYASSAEFVSLEQISIHTSYYNVSNANNLLFYDTTQPAYILTPGYYDLNGLNRILFTNLYKIVLSSNAQNYLIYKYATSTDWTNETLGTLQAVQTFGVLNASIYNGTFFCNIIKIECNLFDAKTTGSSTILDTHQTIEVPVTAPKMSYQVIYFEPNQTKYNLESTSVRIRFLDYNNNVLQFNPLFYPLIVFSFSS